MIPIFLWSKILNIIFLLLKIKNLRMSTNNFLGSLREPRPFCCYEGRQTDAAGWVNMTLGERHCLAPGPGYRFSSCCWCCCCCADDDSDADADADAAAAAADDDDEDDDDEDEDEDEDEDVDDVYSYSACFRLCFFNWLVAWLVCLRLPVPQPRRSIFRVICRGCIHSSFKSEMRKHRKHSSSHVE